MENGQLLVDLCFSPATRRQGFPAGRGERY